MAFSGSEFVPDSQANTNAPRIFRYATTADAIAAVKGSGYFNDAADPTGGYGLRDGDVILAVASDAQSFLYMAVSGAGVATVSTALDFA